MLVTRYIRQVAVLRALGDTTRIVAQYKEYPEVTLEHRRDVGERRFSLHERRQLRNFRTEVAARITVSFRQMYQTTWQVLCGILRRAETSGRCHKYFTYI